ncbi:MAG: phytochromobilin:ferredoxin oxidoreductase [Pirellula sp.]|nr:phytochromobilin:ferredoxin oxidoreductase [Pirellula sp.]
MHPNFTLDYFPAEFFTRPVGEPRRLGLFSRIMARQGSEVTREASQVARDGAVSFEPLVFETRSRMRSHSDETMSIPQEFRQRESLHGRIDLQASQWSIQARKKHIASVRMVYIHGPKNQIINTWIFPNRPDQMPVFAAELIAVGSEVRVAFVDVQVPVIRSISMLDEVSLLTSGVAARFSELVCSEAPPVWATESSQGNFTYARNVPVSQLHRVEECYQAYLDAYLGAFTNRVTGASLSEQNRDELALDELHRYQHHHMESSPGNKFLSKLFGADWTDSFMREFLFAKPRG